jgi:TusA-related sulfurtransferase
MFAPIKIIIEKLNDKSNTIDAIPEILKNELSVKNLEAIRRILEVMNDNSKIINTIPEILEKQSKLTSEQLAKTLEEINE